MKNVITIGGGNGTALTLAALKRYADTLDISAVISTSDSNGSSGRLREEFKTLPAGDILRAVLALASYDGELLRKIFYEKRFTDTGGLDRHNLGNLWLTLGAKYAGDYISAIRALEQVVEAVGHVYPVTKEAGTLVAELSDGQHIVSEGSVDIPTYDRTLRIRRAWLEPAIPADTEALRVIEEADTIILGPGSLYTSIITTLLPLGVGEALTKSSAKIICVAGNTYKTNGETGPTTLSEYVQELQQYVPRRIDTVLYGVSRQTDAGRMNMDTEGLKEYHLVAADIEEGMGVYSPQRLGEVLLQCIM